MTALKQICLFRDFESIFIEIIKSENTYPERKIASENSISERMAI
jgi:hypothetical protein